MASKGKLGAIGLAVVIGVLVGSAFGLVTGLAARYFGWSTALIAPLTGALVGGLVVVVYQLRTAPDGET